MDNNTLFLDHAGHLQITGLDKLPKHGRRYDGTGLGLTIAKAYIELLGGKIWFSSEAGKGSLFCFNIPDTRR